MGIREMLFGDTETDEAGEVVDVYPATREHPGFKMTIAETPDEDPRHDIDQDFVDALDAIDGVRYVVVTTSYLRVVFDHHADASALRAVDDRCGPEGRLTGTQEHLPCVEYPLSDFDA